MTSAAPGKRASLSCLTGLAIIKCNNFKQFANPTSSHSAVITTLLLTRRASVVRVVPGKRGARGCTEELSSALSAPA